MIEPLAAQTGRRIALTTVNGDAVYDSAGASDRPGIPTAVVDPLSVSAFPGLTTSAGTIDRARSARST